MRERQQQHDQRYADPEVLLPSAAERLVSCSEVRGVHGVIVQTAEQGPSPVVMRTGRNSRLILEIDV